MPATPLCALAGVNPEQLADTLRLLTRRHLTVATAESLTAGLLAATLTEIAGASTVVRGSLVCYATDLKGTLAGVDRKLLDRVGPVDAEVARQLADGARRRCDADIGLGLTGVAGPDAQGGKMPGTVFIALYGSGCDDLSSLTPTVPPEDRWQVRARAVREALALLCCAARGR